MRRMSTATGEAIGLPFAWVEMSDGYIARHGDPPLVRGLTTNPSAYARRAMDGVEHSQAARPTDRQGVHEICQSSN